MLDFEFYRTYYPDLINMSQEDLISHWKYHGEHEGRYPNAFIALNKEITNKSLPINFNLRAYLTFNHDVASWIRWDVQAIEHFLQKGHREKRRFYFSPVESFVAPKSDDTAGSPLIEDASEDPDPMLPHETGEPRLPNNFNAISYLARYPDISAVKVDRSWAIEHFLTHGMNEGRVGHPHHVDVEFIKSYYNIDITNEHTIENILCLLSESIEYQFLDLIPVNEEELSFSSGLDPAIIQLHFDEDYYNLFLPRSQSNQDRISALRHFIEVGQFESRDISFDWRFDETFYAAEYDPDVTNDRNNLYRHWITHGTRNGYWPNLERLSKSTYGFNFPTTILNRIFEFSRLAWPSSRIKRPSEILSHIVNRTSEIISFINLSDPGETYFLVELADRHVIGGRPAEADLIYSTLAGIKRPLGRARRHQADLIERGGFPGLATHLRRRIIDDKQGNSWTYIKLAEHLQGHNAQEAVSVLAEASQRSPGSVDMRSRRKQGGYAMLNAAIDQAPSFASEHGTHQAIRKLKTVLELATLPAETWSGGRRIRRVAIYGNFDLPQCRFYRIDTKAEHLTAAGFDVTIFNASHDTEQLIRSLDKTDLLIVHRTPAFPYVIEALLAATSRGIPTAYDIDDLIFSADHYPPPLSSYGGLVSEAAYHGLAIGVPLFEHCMSLCDYGLASTTELARYMQPIVRTGQVFLAPNSLSYKHLQQTKYTCQHHFTRDDRSDRVTIFYGSGTLAHKQDFVEIALPALQGVAKAYGPKIRIVLVGHMQIVEGMSWHGADVHFLEPFKNLNEYWDVLSHSDINLAILEKNTFNDCKSEIKWIEAGMMGIPSVLSRTSTYEEVVEEGTTGMLCSNSLEFERSLRQLVEDEALRRRIGEAARSVILRKYGFAAQAELYRHIVEKIETDRPAPKKKIVIVNVFYPPQAIGGATRVVHDNVRDLKKVLGTDWEISVICTLEGGLTPYECTHYVQDDVRVFAITAADRADVDHLFEDEQMGRAFGRCLDEIGPDLVHFHCIQRLTLSAVDQAARRSIPYFVTMHDGWWISPNQFINGPNDEEELYDFGAGANSARGILGRSSRERAMRRSLSGAAKILSVSEAFAAVMRRSGLRDVAVSTNGVSRLMAHPRSPSPDGRVRIGHVGGLDRHKGIHLIRSALTSTKFSNISFLLIDHSLEIGDRRSETWGTTPVDVRAKVPQSRVAELYSEIDILLMPSVWPESYGLAAREALMCGCWLITSDRGALEECVIEGVNGMIVDVSNPSALRDALVSVDANPERFRTSPPAPPPLRMAVEQAEDIGRMYREFLTKAPATAVSLEVV